ncbi:GL25277 [Drosophila persimilis]|uniref:GL25277 n=1 Tax=Drosophila persimilis TaxID=7234 RepID=B4GRW4_DROPE|nr:GL25277 [Drosophila persimilis]
MFGYLYLVALCLSAATCLEAGDATQLRFPGPAKGRSLPLILQRQEDAAPYPPAGFVPDPPFELPTEEAAVFLSLMTLMDHQSRFMDHQLRSMDPQMRFMDPQIRLTVHQTKHSTMTVPTASHRVQPS